MNLNVSNSIVDFFQGNPYNNSVGSCIEKATSDKNEVENWSLIMKVCDIINATEDGPKLAIRAIKRRLTTEVIRNTTTLLYTLTLLETCVKNCSYRFHLVVCNRDFLQELEKMVQMSSISKSGKCDVQNVVRDKILLLIQTWYDSFKGQPNLREIENTYNYLHECGVQFPMTNLTTMSPIKTPEKSVRTTKLSSQESLKETSVVSTANFTEQREQSIPENLSDKLSKDLFIVQGNIDVMSELMIDYPPEYSIPDEVISLMENLESSCLQMQTRLVELINKWDETDQKETSNLFDLLRVNDDMNTVLIQYDRYERARVGQLNKIISEDELNNRMKKSSLADIYAAQQEVTEFYQGISKVKSSKLASAKVSPRLPQNSQNIQSFVYENNKAEAGKSSLETELNKESSSNSLNTHNDTLDIQRPFRSKASDNKNEFFDL